MDWIEDSRVGKMRQRVFGKPDLIRELVPRFDRQVRQVLDRETCMRVQHVATSGSGDSHMAGVAAEMAFEAIAGVSMEAHTGMHLGRYTIPWMRPRDARSTLVIGISASGTVSRTTESVQLARERGALTLALTANPNGGLAKAAELSLDTAIPDPDVPGARTYLTSLLALYMVALRLGEAREAVSQEQGSQWRAALLHAADVVQATNERISEPVRRCALALRDRQTFMFVGSGPSHGTALYGAAKVIEAAGRHGEIREVEEWAHQERFGTESGAPTFLIAPPGLSYGRAVEVAQSIKDTGKYLIALVDEDEGIIHETSDIVFPVAGRVPEALSTLAYSSALELFASDLAQEAGEAYMRAASPLLRPTHALIRQSDSFASLEELERAQHNSPGE